MCFISSIFMCVNLLYIFWFTKGKINALVIPLLSPFFSHLPFNKTKLLFSNQFITKSPFLFTFYFPPKANVFIKVAKNYIIIFLNSVQQNSICYILIPYFFLYHLPTFTLILYITKTYASSCTLNL